MQFNPKRAMRNFIEFLWNTKLLAVLKTKAAAAGVSLTGTEMQALLPDATGFDMSSVGSLFSGLGDMLSLDAFGGGKVADAGVADTLAAPVKKPLGPKGKLKKKKAAMAAALTGKKTAAAAALSGASTSEDSA